MGAEELTPYPHNALRSVYLPGFSILIAYNNEAKPRAGIGFTGKPQRDSNKTPDLGIIFAEVA